MFSRFLKILKKAQFDKNAAKSFKSYYDKIDKSEAYKRYCKELQGLPCSMQNNLSITQSKNLFKLLNERSDLKILDLGAGSGGLIKSFKDKHSFTGIDLSIENELLNIKQADYHAFQYIEDHFDLVLSIDSLYLVSDRARLLRKINSTLKPQGEFHIFMTLLENYEKSSLKKELENIFKSVHVIDNSKEDKELWHEAYEYLLNNKSEFSSESDKRIFNTKLKEIEKNTSLAHKTSRLHIIATKE